MSSLAVETRLHPGKRIEKLMKFNKIINILSMQHSKNFKPIFML